MRSTTTREELEQGSDRVESVLRKIEQAEHAILRELQCPIDLMSMINFLADIEAGRRRAPWPKKIATRNKTRAMHAWVTLLFIEQTRTSLKYGDEDHHDAVYHAVMATLHAGDSALNAVAKARAHKSARDGGVKRGEKISRDAKGREAIIAKRLKEYSHSDELSDTHRSPVGYIQWKQDPELKAMGTRALQMAVHRLRKRK